VTAELIPELQRLGQLLQQARQAQGVSLDDQAQRLHMGSEQLRALEQGSREELPEAVFVVAQARRVATSLGVNIDAEIAALRESQAFQARTAKRAEPQSRPVPPRAQPVEAATSSPQPKPAGTPARRSSRLLPLGAAAIAAAALGWWGLQRRPLQAPAPSEQAASEQAASKQGAAEQAASQQDASQQAPGSAPGSPQAELVLRSAEPSWLEVRSASNAVLFRGTLTGEQRFPLSGALQVRAGRPDLVTATTGTAPAQPLGPIEAVTWYSFSPEPAAAPAP
jgi:cytoskeleton protein RodZ